MMVRGLDKEALRQQFAAFKNLMLARGVAEYFLSHPQPKVAAKMLRDIALLDEFGLNLSDKYIHRVWGNSIKLWELRTSFANFNERTLLVALSEGKFLLTNVFPKKSNKIPQSEIRKAESIYYKYLESRGE
jgi:phage-related protein